MNFFFHFSGYEIAKEVFQKNTEIQSLLVFDPESNGNSIKNSLISGNNLWKTQVKRGIKIKNFIHFEYILNVF